MTGFAAVAHYNGWMIAVLGASIVFAGLAVLSFFISQLPRILKLLEKQTASQQPGAPAPPEPAKTAEKPGKKDIASQIEPLAAKLGEPFQLAELYRLCRENDIPHPHLSLSRLQHRGILHPEGGGAFTWKSEAAVTQED